MLFLVLSPVFWFDYVSKILNKNDCQHSKRRPKHIKREFSEWSLLLSYKMTFKQQLNGEKQWKMRWRAKPLISGLDTKMA